MKKRCRRCGAVLGGFRKYVALSDCGICKKCFEELGFDYNSKDEYTNNRYDQIACGYNCYVKRKQNKTISNFGFQFAHYGEERDFEATKEELEMFEILRSIIKDDDLRLTSKSNNYVSAVIGDFDVARMKFTDRAHWIIIPYAEPKAAKHQISSPSDILQFRNLIDKNQEYINKIKKGLQK